jgi:hypothetical protein
MSKKSNPVEVLKPVDPVPNVRAQLEAFIEQKMAEIMGADKTGIFEPFFQTKAVSAAIKKLQTVMHHRKWHNYFAEWGCLVCEKKDRPHESLGMCLACHHRIQNRLQTILRFTEGEERPDAPPFTPDRLTELASGAVQRQLEAPKETRAYITKAERRAIRGPHRCSDAALALRVAAQEKRARREEMWRQARALHVEQKLTWREIAQRLDPDFDKDPKAAIERIETGARRVSLVRDLQDVARKALKSTPR